MTPGFTILHILRFIWHACVMVFPAEQPKFQWRASQKSCSNPRKVILQHSRVGLYFGAGILFPSWSALIFLVWMCCTSSQFNSWLKVYCNKFQHYQSHLFMVTLCVPHSFRKTGSSRKNRLDFGLGIDLVESHQFHGCFLVLKCG